MKMKLVATTVVLTKQAVKDLERIPGYHDEPLKGQREGQRSIRLSKSYRAIYLIDKCGLLHLVKILEVNKHDY